LIHEMIYTSALQTFEAPGLGVVAMTRELPKPLNLAMRRLSRFDFFRDPPSDPAFAVYSHTKENVNGQTWHILSRTCNAGLDYTSRNNFLSHHVALPRELLSGKSTVFDYILTPNLFRSQWSGPPQLLEMRQIQPVAQPARFAWKASAAGKQGLQVFLHWHSQSEFPLFLMVDGAGEALTIFADVASRMPVEKANDVTFITALGADIRGQSFNWIGLLRGKELSQRIVDSQSPRLLDIARPAPTVPTQTRAPISSSPSTEDVSRQISKSKPDRVEQDDFFETLVKPDISREKKRIESGETQPSKIPPPPPRSTTSTTKIVAWSCVCLGLVLGIVSTLAILSDPERKAIAHEDKPAVEQIQVEGLDPPTLERPGNELPLPKTPENTLPDFGQRPPSSERPGKPFPLDLLPKENSLEPEIEVFDEYICIDAQQFEGVLEGTMFLYDCALIPNAKKQLRQLGVQGDVLPKTSNKQNEFLIFLKDKLIAEIGIENDRQIVIKPSLNLSGINELRVCPAVLELKNKDSKKTQRIYFLFNKQLPPVLNIESSKHPGAEKWREQNVQSFFTTAFALNKNSEHEAEERSPESEAADLPLNATFESSGTNDDENSAPPEESSDKKLQEKEFRISHTIDIHNVEIPFLAGNPMKTKLADALPLTLDGVLLPLNFESAYEISVKLLVMKKFNSSEPRWGLGVYCPIPEVDPQDKANSLTAEQKASWVLLKHCKLSGQLKRLSVDSQEPFPVLLFGEQVRIPLQPVQEPAEFKGA